MYAVRPRYVAKPRFVASDKSGCLKCRKYKKNVANDKSGWRHIGEYIFLDFSALQALRFVAGDKSGCGDISGSNICIGTLIKIASKICYFLSTHHNLPYRP